jgi:arylsulfatase A-like enzyme
MQPVDIMNTVLELADVPVLADVQGKSLVPILRGGSVEERPVAVTSQALTDNPNRGVCSSITNGEWTLHYRGPDHPAELYHLAEDSKEENNLYTSNREIAERLHADHLQLLRSAGTSQQRMELRSRLP